MCRGTKSCPEAIEPSRASSVALPPKAGLQGAAEGLPRRYRHRRLTLPATVNDTEWGTPRWGSRALRTPEGTTATTWVQPGESNPRPEVPRWIERVPPKR
jgi:hypothetical protein